MKNGRKVLHILNVGQTSRFASLCLCRQVYNQEQKEHRIKHLQPLYVPERDGSFGTAQATLDLLVLSRDRFLVGKKGRKKASKNKQMT